MVNYHMMIFHHQLWDHIIWWNIIMIILLKINVTFNHMMTFQHMMIFHHDMIWWLVLKGPAGQWGSRLVDRPTQLVCIWIFICWVGGGNPCGVADFCIGDSCRNKKHTGFIFFFKISFLCIFCPWHSKKQGKKLIQTLKKPVFTVLLDSVLVQIKLN